VADETKIGQPSPAVPEVASSNDRLVECLLKHEKSSQIECPYLGMGMAVHCLGKGVQRFDKSLDNIAVISGLSCTNQVARNIKVNSFHTTRGRAIPFAIGLKLANPKLNVVVMGVDMDLFTIGGSHFINAARRNIDMTVICVNNFDYMLAAGKDTTNSNETSEPQFTSVGNYNKLFNLPFIAEMAGASYVARWTALHYQKVTDSVLEGLNKKGFSFIEILAPCPDILEKAKDLETKLERLSLYYDKSLVRNDINTREVELGLMEEIIIGRFVDRERPTYRQSMIQHLMKKLGDRYKPMDEDE